MGSIWRPDSLRSTLGHVSAGDSMSQAEASDRFLTTSWTLIARAPNSREDMERLLQAYWSPIYAYLRRRGNQPEDAADLTQQFLVTVLLERDLVSKADPARGRFRSFLLTALRNFRVDEHRRRHGRALAAGGDGGIEAIESDGSLRSVADIREDVLHLAEPEEHTDDPVSAFDRQWAKTVLEIAIQRTHDACLASGQERHWRAFQARVLHPIQHGSEPAAVERLARELGANDPREIYHMVQTVKRRLLRDLRRAVAKTVERPADVDAELAEIQRHLGVEG